MNALDRFWAKVQKGPDCWEWTGCRTDAGYGSFYDARTHGAHRYSYALHFGPIPSGLVVMHSCDNRACVRPDHLTLGTHGDNSQDMTRKGRGKVPVVHGESHGESKLTEAAVRDILTSRETGRALALRYGVSPSAISLVRRGKAWQIAARRLSQDVLDFTQEPA